jgi:predicted phage replisome organizer
MQWIKVFTDIFSNPKMQLLLKERDEDTFFRVWIQLLTLAGTSELDGKIMLSETTPMSVESLAAITHKSYKKIQNILNKLIHYEMIICEDNIYRIKNWDKYQSADKYLKTLEQNRERQRRFREKNKEDDNVNVTLGNDTEDNIKENNKIEKSKKEFSKTLPYMNYEQRQYSDEFWEQLIDNNKK